MEKYGNKITRENIEKSLEWKILEELINIDEEIFRFQKIDGVNSEINLKRHSKSDSIWELFNKLVYSELTNEEKIVFLQYMDYKQKLEDTKNYIEKRYFKESLSDIIEKFGFDLMEEYNINCSLEEFMTNLSSKTK